ncbi:MAG: hypothetical protein K940chlam5_01228 [Candidatus Anoxychlamydiales bacterium]|uniref:Uncharacterized protein n=1 Tax=marine sediment metagenome TaxID=412755 RepID=A0A0F9L9Q8_9ZZZZ|nr:hypothetical protein [Candidatus Anoxychlamydiales bacterium]
MFRYLKGGMLGLALLATMFLSVSELSAVPRKTYKSKSYSTKSYVKKPYKPKMYSTRSYSQKSYAKKSPYQGYGKPSKVNGLPKCKTTSGHVKKTSKGYTYVNPYAKSK